MTKLHSLNANDLLTTSLEPIENKLDSPSEPSVIDIRRAVPPTPAHVNTAFSKTLSAMSKRSDLGYLFRLPAAIGTERMRQAGAAWVSQRFCYIPDPSRILLTHGTQNALTIVFRHFALTQGAGNRIIATEHLTYTSLRSLVAHLGLELVGLRMDGEGILPDAFEALCIRQRPLALYVNPTLHNPTVAIMSHERRRQLAEIAQRFDVPIVEDDVQGYLDPDLPKPIAALAPEITWYIAAFGKSINLGLRNTYLVAPSPAALDAAIAPISKLTNWGAGALSAEISTQWIEDGTAQRILEEMSLEAAARQKIAVRNLGEFQLKSHPAAHHGWLVFPDSLRAADLVVNLHQAGVLVWEAEEFAAEGATAIQGVRFSFSNVATREELELGLLRTREVLLAHGGF